MAGDSTAKKSEAAEKLRVNERKWSKPLMDAGWTAIPSVIVERQRALGLDAIDMNILIHLATYWWTPDNVPHPSKGTMAQAIAVTPRTIQRRIAALEAAGLIRREERRIQGKGSRTNRYHFDGLIKAAQPYANEKMEDIARREAEDKKRIGRKGRPKLRVIEGT